MKFDLTAAKAYVGAIVATSAPAVSSFLIGVAEAATGFDIPTSVEALIVTAVTAVIGYVAVYVTPNKQTAR
jgi:hypothetical protein